MKRMTKIAVALGAALTLGLGAAAVSAQPYGYGMGPGMMYGYGPGYGAGSGYGPGYGMGPGMMYGYGPGYGRGPGWMGGYGPGSPNGYQGNPQQGYPDLDTPAGRLFARTCSQCHALPDPRQHTAGQWPSVVARMELHMRQSNMPLPGEPEIKDIDAFLGQHTSGRE
jgi:hypothetical protein